VSTLVTGQKQRWTIAATAAGVVVVALLFLFRMPPPPTAFSPSISTAGPTVKPAVQLATRADELLRAETDIRDLRPLFLPTERNATLPELKRELGRTLLEDEPVKSTLLESEVVVTKDLPPVAIINGKPANEAAPLDALASEATVTSLLGFGRNPQPVPSMHVRAGYVEVVSAETGLRVYGEVLPAEALVPGDKPWAPLEFLARIDAVGLAAPLVVTTTSGVEEIDAHFKKFLGKTYRIGERLPPGFYRVIVAP
jgi:hypothetical protein